MAKHPPEILLGFDFGTKRIGVAVGQTITQTARPLETVKAQQWDAIDKLVKHWQPDALVVGIPLNMDGSEQKLTQLAKQFVTALKNRYQLPTYEMDERLTTQSVRENLFSKGGYKALHKEAIDSLAAQLILQNWLTK